MIRDVPAAAPAVATADPAVGSGRGVLPTVAFHSFGCKLNQCDTAGIRSRFVGAGFFSAAAGEPAAVHVINTCSVTGKAGAQSRQAIRQALRNHPDARIVITGCYSQLAGKELLALEELKDKYIVDYYKKNKNDKNSNIIVR